MNKIFLYIFIFSVSIIRAQDIDIYKKNINSNFQLPEIPANMSYSEFKILSTNLRLQDMGMAMVFPGHIHFKIGEKKTAYYILGARSVGFAGVIYMSAKNQSVYKTLILNNAGIDREISTMDELISYTSVILIGGSYLFDWIHGKYKLREKQTKIRYKYAKQKLKTGFSLIEIDKFLYPGLNIKYTF